MLAAVQQGQWLADDFGIRITGDAGEGLVDRDELVIPVQHGHGFAHAAHHFAGDPVFVFGVMAGGDVAGGAGNAHRPAFCIALDHASTRTHPGPTAVAAHVHAVFGHEQRGVALQVAAQQLHDLRQVLFVDGGYVALSGQDGDFGGMRGAFIRTHAVQLASHQVVIPEMLARCPQGQLQVLVAFAQGFIARGFGRLALPGDPVVARGDGDHGNQYQQGKQHGQRARREQR